MTSFEHDMGEMVRESGVTEAKKTLAMNYVRATGKIANGSRGNVEALCDAMIAQTPIMLEMYLERHAQAQDVEEAIAAHLAACPAKISGGGDNIAIAGMTGMNWQRMIFSVATKVSWPGAWLITAFMFKDQIATLLLRLGGGLP
jgi:hypothetical protein